MRGISSSSYILTIEIYYTFILIAMSYKGMTKTHPTNTKIQPRHLQCRIEALKKAASDLDITLRRLMEEQKFVVEGSMELKVVREISRHTGMIAMWVEADYEHVKKTFGENDFSEEEVAV